MTVRELMEMLSEMPQDAKVVYPDTYAQSEGWWDGCEDETNSVDMVTLEGDGTVLLCAED